METPQNLARLPCLIESAYVTIFCTASLESSGAADESRFTSTDRSARISAESVGSGVGFRVRTGRLSCVIAASRSHSEQV